MPGERRSLLAESIRRSMELLEALIAVVLIVLVLLSLVHLAAEVIRMELEGFSKEGVLTVLDIALLLILAIDILRTLAVAIARRALPIRIVVEAAMVAILREIIAVEVRHLDWKMVLSLSIAFALLGAVWTVMGVLQRRGLLAPTATEDY